MSAPSRLFRFFSPKASDSETRPAVDLDDQRAILLQKSPEWEYEQEYRLVIPLAGLSRATRRGDGKEKAFISLPLDAVKAVYIGFRMPQENRDELLASLRLPGRNKIACYGMRRHRAKYAVFPVLWSEIKRACDYRHSPNHKYSNPSDTEFI